MIQGGPGAGIHGAGWLLPGESMSPGGRSMMSRGGGLVPGAAPMGAGLSRSTGAAGAVKAGGLSRQRAGASSSFDSDTVPYGSDTVKKNRYTFDQKNSKMGISRKAPKMGKKRSSNIQYHLSYAANLYSLMQKYTVTLLFCIKSCIRIQKMDREKNECKKQPKKGV